MRARPRCVRVSELRQTCVLKRGGFPSLHVDARMLAQHAAREQPGFVDCGRVAPRHAVVGGVGRPADRSGAPAVLRGLVVSVGGLSYSVAEDPLQDSVFSVLNEFLVILIFFQWSFGILKPDKFCTTFLEESMDWQ